MIDLDNLDGSLWSMISMVLAILVLGMLICFTVVVIDNSYFQMNQSEFQRGVTNAVRAYSSEYDTTPMSMMYISEGYLTQDDLDVYKVNSNPVKLNLTSASDFLYAVLEANTPNTKAQLKANGIYIANVVTTFSSSGPVYILSILKDGKTSVLSNVQCNTVYEVENRIQSTLNVKVDIATGFNASIRNAQKYDRDLGTTGSADGYTSKKTYSTYSTNMFIGIDVPIRGLVTERLHNVYELQTYSIGRSDK